MRARFDDLTQATSGLSSRRGVLRMFGTAAAAATAAAVLKPFRGDGASGGPQCGTVTCAKGQTCSDPAAGLCCNAGETLCGPACCKSGVACENRSSGICGCPAGRTPCQSAGARTCCDPGTACSPGNATCVKPSGTTSKLSLRTTLNGTNEVPPKNSTATGTFVGQLDMATLQLCYTLTASGLTAPATAAHIHNAPAGQNGPVVVTFTPVPATTSFTLTTCATVPAPTAQGLAQNPANFYVNVHDSTYPGGEIRGQLG
jgi:hypothetical protein